MIEKRERIETGGNTNKNMIQDWEKTIRYYGNMNLCVVGLYKISRLGCF